MKRILEAAKEAKSELEITPMIDVVFLILIFFMCATKFKIPEGTLRSYLPRDRGLGTSSPTLTRGCRITLLKRGEEVIVYADSVQVPNDDFDGEFERQRGVPGPNEAFIEDHIRRRKETYTGLGPKGLPVIIDFGEKVPLKYTVQVLNICRRLEIEDVAFAAPEVPID